jgi:hypothetical protein
MRLAMLSHQYRNGAASAERVLQVGGMECVWGGGQAFGVEGGREILRYKTDRSVTIREL